MDEFPREDFGIDLIHNWTEGYSIPTIYIHGATQVCTKWSGVFDSKGFLIRAVNRRGVIGLNNTKDLL